MRWLAALIPLVTLMSSCGIARDPADGLTRLEEWQSQLPELRAASSTYEQEALADGIVTSEEHEAGFEAMVRCIENRGGEVVGVSRGERGEVEEWSARGDTKVSDRCQREFFQHIQLGYAITLKPDLTPGALVRLMVGCLETAGITDLPENAEELELVDLMKTISRPDREDGGSALIAFDACYNEHG